MADAALGWTPEEHQAQDEQQTARLFSLSAQILREQDSYHDIL